MTGGIAKRIAAWAELGAVAFILVLGVSACGKKEPLKPPEGATYPRQYPPR